MTQKLRAAIKELRTRPWTAATHDMCQLDDGYDAFVRTAKDKIHEPSMVVTASRIFGTLIPKCLHHSPAFVMWLPPELGHVAHVLPHVIPKAGERTSTDLRKRDLVLSWTCFGKSYIAKASALHVSMDRQAGEGAIPLVIASETHTAVSVLLLDDLFLGELSRVGGRCGENYRPEQEYTREELAVAMKRKWAHRQSSDDFVFQAPSDFEVLLRPRRAFRPDWIVEGGFLLLGNRRGMTAGSAQGCAQPLAQLVAPATTSKVGGARPEPLAKRRPRPSAGG